MDIVRALLRGNSRLDVYRTKSRWRTTPPSSSANRIFIKGNFAIGWDFSAREYSSRLLAIHSADLNIHGDRTREETCGYRFITETNIVTNTTMQVS